MEVRKAGVQARRLPAQKSVPLTAAEILAAVPAPAFKLFQGGRPRLRLRLRELKAAFGDKQGGAPVRVNGARLPALHTPFSCDAAGAEYSPPIPSSPAADGGAQRGRGIGRAALLFIAAGVMMQVGASALRTAMPLVIQQAAGSFQAVAHLSLLFAGAAIVGRQLAPALIRRAGLKWTFVGANLARAAMILGLGLSLAGGTAGAPLLLALHTAYGLFTGITITSAESTAAALVGRDQGRLERYWTLLTTLNQLAGILMPIATGAAVAGWGFLPAVFAFPAATVLAVLTAVFVLRPAQNPELRARPTVREGRLGFYKQLGSGARLVFGSPVLRSAFFAYGLLTVWMPITFFLLAPAYGLLVSGGNAALAAAVSGWQVGLYGLGGMLGGVLMMLQQRRRKDMEDAARREALRRSLLRWSVLGLFGLSALATLALPAATLGSLAALPAALKWLGPLTLPALAMIPFGVTQSVTLLKLRSFFQSRVPSQKEMPEAMSFFGSATMIFGTLILWGISGLFEAFSSAAAFQLLALGLAPIAALGFLVLWRLARHSRDG